MEVTEQRVAAIRCRFRRGIFWGSVAVLFLVVHATRTVVADLPLPENLFYYLPSIKGMLFLFSVAFLMYSILSDTGRIFRNSNQDTLRSTVVISLGVAALLMLLVFHFGNASMGEHYARRSVSPFEQDTGWYNKRLLMPAIAHILFFRDNWLYYAFSTLVFLLFLGVLYAWLRNHADVKPWQFFSLSTCSFVIFQNQFPGYPDVLVFTFFVLVMTSEFTQKSKLYFLLLALVTHESSIFVGTLLAYRYLNRSGRLSYLAAIILYGAIWAAAYDFSVPAMFQNHYASGRSGVEWLLISPQAWSLGVFIAFKAVWLLLALATIVAIQHRLYRDAAFVVACVCAGLLLTVLGVDTSRHMAVAFPGALVALETIQHRMQRPLATRTLSTIFAVNLIIPSFYVGLNTGIVWRPGLYSLLYFPFASLTD